MIEVTIGKSGLRLRGHAGFAAHGSDIVCAAASMLAFALAAGLRAVRPEKPPLVEAGNGSFQLEAPHGAYAQERLAGMFAVIRAGYELLEQEYPEYVQVLSDEHSEIQQKPDKRPENGQKEEK